MANRAKAYRIALCSVCLFFFLQSESPALTPTAETLRDKVLSLDLGKSREWQVLGHYKPTRDGWKSLISDPGFFLARDGRENPEAELSATLQAMFASPVSDESHALCRFPARVAWLKKALAIPDQALPTVSCQDNNELLERIAPHGAALVFPSAAFRGLGAMFGHTLVRIDARDRSPLISYAVSYSALLRNSDPVRYIWDGLTGGFPGYYTLMPYYRKMNEYKEMEERDIWEYRLKLTPDEVRMMALHVLELRNITSEYYFLDENCALQILFLLEAARPSLRLVDHYWENASYWVIPSDTIQLLWREKILEPPVYQPSLSRKLDYLSMHVDTAVRNKALNLANSKILAADTPATSELYDSPSISRELAALIVQYRFSKLQMTQEEFQNRYNSLMKDNNKDLSLSVPTPTPPHEGHAAGRVELATGYGNSAPFLQLGWRPSYHDRDDYSAGYPDGGTLNFFNLKGRYYPTRAQARLQQAEVLGFGSLSPVNPFIGKISWSLHTGAEQQYLADDREHLLYYLDGGAGQSYHGTMFGMAYWLFKGSFLAGGGLRHGVDLGPELDLGVRKELGGDWQGYVTGTTGYYGISENKFLSKITTSLVHAVNRDTAIALSSIVHISGRNSVMAEYSLQWNYYY